MTPPTCPDCGNRRPTSATWDSDDVPDCDRCFKQWIVVSEHMAKAKRRQVFLAFAGYLCDILERREDKHAD